MKSGMQNMKHKITETEIEALLNKNKFINSENGLKRVPMERESLFLDRIRQGKYKEVSFGDYKEIEPYMGESTKSRLKKFEYTTVAGITLAVRAAIAGGVRPDDAYDFSETMLQKLEQTESIEEMHDILEYTASALAFQVQKCRKEKSSYILEQCKIYINRNIFNKIYLSRLAEYVGMNPSYLSRLFSVKEGLTIQEYIQKEKMNIACNLLRFSNSSIAEIAQYMGFQSQSNFSALFKKWVMMTPTQYRNKNKN